MAPLTSTQAPPSDKRRVIDRALADGGHPTLEELAQTARRNPHPHGRGQRTSWPLLATQVHTLTGEYVSWQSLRNWFRHLDAGD